MIVQTNGDNNVAYTSDECGWSDDEISNLSMTSEKLDSGNWGSFLGVSIGAAVIGAALMCMHLDPSSSTAAKSPIMLIIAIIAMSLPLIPAGPYAIRKQRQAKRQSAITKAKSQTTERSRAVTLRKWNSKLTSNAYSFNRLLQHEELGPHLQKVLQEEMRSGDIAHFGNLTSYNIYLEENPEGRLFPKIKPHLDAFLQATVQLDEQYAEQVSTASSSFLKNHEAEVDALIEEYVDYMQATTAGHESQLSFTANESLCAAQTYLREHFGGFAIESVQGALAPSQ